MNGDYKNYLFIIIFLVFALLASLIFLFYGRYKKAKKKTKPVDVTGGNTNVFFDRNGNVTLIPYVKDKYGNGKATLYVETLKMPYAQEQLGILVKKSLNGCKHSTSCTNKELLDILCVSDWKQFSEDKKNISVYFREGYGLVFNTTTRMIDGAYQFNINGIEKSMPGDIDDVLLGNTLLQLLGRCR